MRSSLSSLAKSTQHFTICFKRDACISDTYSWFYILWVIHSWSMTLFSFIDICFNHDSDYSLISMSYLPCDTLADNWLIFMFFSTICVRSINDNSYIKSSFHLLIEKSVYMRFFIIWTITSSSEYDMSIRISLGSNLSNSSFFCCS